MGNSPSGTQFAQKDSEDLGGIRRVTHTVQVRGLSLFCQEIEIGHPPAPLQPTKHEIAEMKNR